MPKVAAPLSDLAIKSLTSRGKAKDLVSVGGVAGLKIQITSSGSKSWIFRVQVAGRVRDIGLGSYPTVSLRQAREIAANMKFDVLRGTDPLAVKRKAKAEALKAGHELIFREAAEQYIASIEKSWRNSKTAAQWRSSLVSYAYPTLGPMPVNNIDTTHIIDVLQPIWFVKTETASRVRSRVENILAYAITRGFRSKDNPARWAGHLSTLLPSPEKLKDKNHHPALPYARAAEFWNTISSFDTPSSLAVQLIVLTGLRSAEVREATWDEFDFHRRVWVIGQKRRKAEKQHTVPLNQQTILILEKIKNLQLGQKKFSESGLLFPNQRSLVRPMSDVALGKVIEKANRICLSQGREGLTDPHMNGRRVTIHGFRSTFRDWAGEVSCHEREVIEHALAHKLKDRAEAAYQRGTYIDKRRSLMADWAEFVTGSKNVEN